MLLYGGQDLSPHPDKLVEIAEAQVVERWAPHLCQAKYQRCCVLALLPGARFRSADKTKEDMVV